MVKKIKGDIIQTMQQAGDVLGLSLPALKLIKKLYPESFTTNRVDILKIKAWLAISDNKKKLDDAEHNNSSYDGLRREKLKYDVELKKLLVAEKNNELIAIPEIEEFMRLWSLRLSNILLSKLVNELPARIGRLESTKHTDACKELYNEIVNQIQTDALTWLDNYKNNDTTVSKNS